MRLQHHHIIIIKEEFVLKSACKSLRFLFAMLLLSTLLLMSGGCGGSDSQPSQVSPFAGGSGTQDDPYQVATPQQLAKVNDFLDQHFVLTADIDLSSYENWTPIGTHIPIPENVEIPNTDFAFTGTFDGKGHTISNVKITLGDDSMGVGLFGCVTGNETEQSIKALTPDNLATNAGTSLIKNLTVNNVDVKGGFFIGGVIGELYYGNIDNVRLTGNNRVVGSIYGSFGAIGGLVGMLYGVVENCTAQADVVAPGGPNEGMSGIIVGGTKHAVISNCHATGTVTADGERAMSIGGLAGCLQDSPFIEDCTVNATISASGEKSFMIGGLIGHAGNYDEANPTLIKGCSANVNITVADSALRVGGILGSNWYIEAFLDELSEPSIYRIMNCTTSGTIIGNATQVGSIAGYGYDSAITDCSSTITWSAGTISEAGKIQTSQEQPEAIGTDYYPSPSE
jgi:hypothetical protein